MFGEKYFNFIKQVRALLGKTSGADDGVDFTSMVNDVSWFGCYDDGMTPEEAVEEFKRKTMN